MCEVLLSICIPTYNRGWCIKQQIEMLSKSSSIQHGSVDVLISDNCSTDDTQLIVEEAILSGFNCTYIRNDANLGMDGNFISCFKKARGKYVWILGDDDFIYPESIEKIIEVLSSDKEYGLLHIDMNVDKTRPRFIHFSDKDLFLKHISYWITFLSGNIVNSKYISQIALEKYVGTYFSQIPVYLTALGTENNNLIINFKVFDFAKDAETNGGYNIFDVFVTNYLMIIKEGFNRKFYKYTTYLFLKKDILNSFLIQYVYKFLFKKDTCHSFDVRGAWKILFKHYWINLYFYFLIIRLTVRYLIKG